jgi:hypothetical protein
MYKSTDGGKTFTAFKGALSWRMVDGKAYGGRSLEVHDNVGHESTKPDSNQIGDGVGYVVREMSAIENAECRPEGDGDGSRVCTNDIKMTTNTLTTACIRDHCAFRADCRELSEKSRFRQLCSTG